MEESEGLRASAEHQLTSRQRVAGTFVFSETPHRGEAAAAGRAAERLLSCMNKMVSLQVVGLTEAPPTDAALKRLLAAVNTFVSYKILRHAKALSADLTDVWPLASVSALV